MIGTQSLNEIVQCLGAKPLAQDICFSRVSTDTRTLQQGDLYLALKGERFDGNRFLSQAETARALEAIVSSIDESVALPQLVVQDMHQALGVIATENR